MKIFLLYLIALCLGLLLLSCGSTIPDIHYYLIDYPAVQQNNNGTPILNIAIGVERFQAAPLLRDERLVYRDSPYEAKYYHYHRWISRPEDLVTEKVLEHLQAANLAHQVVAFPKFSHVDYVLGGTIKALEEWDEGNQWYARVHITFELFDQNTNERVWTTSIEKKNSVIDKKTMEVIKGINVSLQQCVDELSVQLRSFFATR